MTYPSTELMALANPTRAALLAKLESGPKTVGELASGMAVSRPAVSQHLRALEAAKLVTVRLDGTRRWYRARPDGLAELRRWVESMWSDGLGDLKRVAEQEERARKRSRTKHTRGARS